MKILQFECMAGISGDMTLGALISVGVPQAYLIEQLNKLHLHDEFELHIRAVHKQGIGATKVDVVITREHAHDHHHDRNLHTIEHMIQGSHLSDAVKTLAMDIFVKVAQAEATVHQKPLDEVHFHEVGAIDSIVDIVGTAICIDYLKPDKIIFTPLHEGSGFVKCAHGLMPVPAPATLEIMRSHQIPYIQTGVQGELVTPTGAAIAATLANEFTQANTMTIQQIGYGAGSKNFDFPNVLRVSIGQIEPQTTPEKVTVIQTNIDDCSGELLGYCLEKLLEEGALDVFYTPIFMKKNRPATLLTVLCKAEDVQKFTTIIFAQTTSIGVRLTECTRIIMQRAVKTVETPYGALAVKVCTYGELQKIAPEYESAKELANTQSVPLREIYLWVSKNLQ
ncbi:MAG: nickel pincer cofactor biosynthesis protein LarC [Hyphomonadaceae bacterium]|nr:nickel pincer cofactor biosynthesis protein LarC [Clostridia bacterium]